MRHEPYTNTLANIFYMKIRYTKKRLRANLILGLLWLALSLAKGLFSVFDDWTDFFFVGMAILYLGQYLIEWQNQYLSIDQDQIKVNYPFGKKINLSDINRIKKFAGDYIIKTDRRELIINTQIIDRESLNVLNQVLATLDLPPDKTPFANNGYG